MMPMPSGSQQGCMAESGSRLPQSKCVPLHFPHLPAATAGRACGARYFVVRFLRTNFWQTVYVKRPNHNSQIFNGFIFGNLLNAVPFGSDASSHQNVKNVVMKHLSPKMNEDRSVVEVFILLGSCVSIQRSLSSPWDRLAFGKNNRLQNVCRYGILYWCIMTGIPQRTIFSRRHAMCVSKQLSSTLAEVT
jgi:hypothetical protein